MRSSKVMGLGVALAMGLGLTLSGARDASACGGAFVPPNEDDSPVTTHRMILSLSPQQTTLYDEIEFTGSASSFAWVLPIKGTATVGLSADLLFSSIDELTETQVVTPPTNCPPAPSCDNEAFGGEEEAPEAAGAAKDANTVTVTEQQQVGPYETVQLHSTDAGALNAWLTAHGYSIPTAAASVISGYVAEQFNFLAMKLAPGQGVTAMRPVRVTTAGASPVLPLRMVAVGTGATTSITLWVIADGRYEPQNFPFFTISDSEIAWDWATSSSTYPSVLASKEAALGGRGWEVESSLELAQYTLTSLVLSGGEDFGGGFGGGASGEAVVPATGTYLPIGDAGAAPDSGDYDSNPPAVVDGGPESADQVRQQDLTTLFAGITGPNARITRLRSDIAHAALSADLQLQASSDQSELSNIHNPTQQIGEPQCTVFDTSCNAVGTLPRSEATVLSATSGTNSGGGGCSTADARGGLASRAAFGVFFGLVTALGAAGARRRRRTPR